MIENKKIERVLIYLVICRALLYCPPVSAQLSRIDSVQATVQQRQLNLYQFTNNPGTIPYSGWAAIGSAGIYVYSSAGAFKRSMDAYSTKSAAVTTSGYRSLNKWSFSGNFSYQKTFDKAVAWSNVYKPYDDNPFRWVDSNSGKWIRDEVAAQITITAPPVGKFVTAGLAVDYLAGSGARTNEPKPFYRIRDISIRPGIYWQPSVRHRFGFTINLSFVQEENEIGLYSNSNVLLFRLRGYGTFSRSPMVTGNRRRSGHESGVTLHYEKRWQQYNLLIHGQFSNRQEEVFEGTAVKAITGNYTQYKWQGGLSLFKGTLTKGSVITALFNQGSGFADDFIYQAETANQVKREGTVSWSTWTTTRNKALWQWRITPGISELITTDHATQTYFNIVQTRVAASLNYRLRVSQKWVLDILPLVQGNWTVQKDWTNGTSNSIIKDVILPDFEIQSANNFVANIKMMIELHASNTVTHCVSARYGQLLAFKDALNRNFSQLQYLIFF